jgi:1,3-beta-glucan synthase component
VKYRATTCCIKVLTQVQQSKTSDLYDVCVCVRAGGNGEQSISRDVHRLGTRLDWFRLMSWYHSGIGFFINSCLTMGSVYIAIWLVFFFKLTDSLEVDGAERTEANLTSTLATVQLFQLGLLSIIPFWGELCLENGFLEVCRHPVAID